MYLVAAITWLAVVAFLIKALSRRAAPVEPAHTETLLDRKLASIRLGERDGVEALRRILHAPDTPDRQRAEAITLYAAFATNAELHALLEAVFDGAESEPHTLTAAFRLADRFPRALHPRLEAFAVDAFNEPFDEDQRVAAALALGHAGAPQALFMIARARAAWPADTAVGAALRAAHSRLQQRWPSHDPTHAPGRLSLTSTPDPAGLLSFPSDRHSGGQSS